MCCFIRFNGLTENNDKSELLGQVGSPEAASIDLCNMPVWIKLTCVLLTYFVGLPSSAFSSLHVHLSVLNSGSVPVFRKCAPSVVRDATYRGRKSRNS